MCRVNCVCKKIDILDVRSIMQGKNNTLPEGVTAMVELIGTLTGLKDLKILFLVSDEEKRFLSSNSSIEFNLIFYSSLKEAQQAYFELDDYKSLQM